MSRFFAILSLLFLGVMLLSACASSSNMQMDGKSMSVSEAQMQAAQEAQKMTDKQRYVLGIGDKVKITTFNQDNLSGEFVIDNSGKIIMPLLGGVEAAGKTQQQLAGYIINLLKQGYLVNPKVSVDVVGYQKFYIVGEVQQPGSYDYVSSLNVIKAIALAGGFTRRAATDRYQILRGVGDNQKKIAANDETLILPGDAIRVGERFF